MSDTKAQALCSPPQYEIAVTRVSSSVWWAVSLISEALYRSYSSMKSPARMKKQSKTNFVGARLNFTDTSCNSQNSTWYSLHGGLVYSCIFQLTQSTYCLIKIHCDVPVRLGEVKRERKSQLGLINLIVAPSGLKLRTEGEYMILPVIERWGIKYGPLDPLSFCLLFREDSSVQGAKRGFLKKRCCRGLNAMDIVGMAGSHWTW